jgi:hypothetical protein
MVPMVEERDQSGEMVKRYPLAARMGNNAFEYKPTFVESMVLKFFQKAYKTVAPLQSGQDLVEEYLPL